MKSIQILFMIFLGSFLVVSCSKVKLPKGTPKCVKKEIKQNVFIDKVYQYEYKGESVYLINLGNVEYSSLYVIDRNCEVTCENYLGQWITCTDFDSVAINKKLIWSKKQ